MASDTTIHVVALTCALFVGFMKIFFQFACRNDMECKAPWENPRILHRKYCNKLQKKFCIGSSTVKVYCDNWKWMQWRGEIPISLCSTIIAICLTFISDKQLKMPCRFGLEEPTCNQQCMMITSSDSSYGQASFQNAADELSAHLLIQLSANKKNLHSNTVRSSNQWRHRCKSTTEEKPWHLGITPGSRIDLLELVSDFVISVDLAGEAWPLLFTANFWKTTFQENGSPDIRASGLSYRQLIKCANL